LIVFNSFFASVNAFVFDDVVADVITGAVALVLIVKDVFVGTAALFVNVVAPPLPDKFNVVKAEVVIPAVP